MITSSLGLPSLSSIGLSFNNIKKLLSDTSPEETIELRDVSLQTATYNKVIPEVFGQIRMAGNIIWSTDIVKTNIYHPQKVHLFSATEEAYTEYYARASFAIAICKGKVDCIKNIYANGVPINITAYKIKIYLGTEDQPQDETIKSYLGADIPAFRDLCYVVFTDFPLEEFNNSIPNFTFDIVRTQEFQEENCMENLVKSMIMIPGSGEFVYDTEVQKKINGKYIMGEFYKTEKDTILNKHTSLSHTDAVESLNDMCKTFPNVDYVSLVVCWFCNNLNCGEAKIYPACEYHGCKVEPEGWSVAGTSRNDARIIGKDAEGNIRYGGTPSDASVLRYVKEIKNRGLKVCLYPMLMVDTENKPWRGHITGKANDVYSFFNKTDGYNNFIKHYVNLLNGYIDSVIIASEMVGMTKIVDENGNYPSVNEICNLATSIKSMVGDNVKIIYAGDWSEYHHDGRGYYNLDKIWACNAVDYIGIDAYFPLTDKTTTTYDKEEIKNGWRNGEGYDFYYTDENRTTKAPLSPEWAWKNVEYFWSHYHYNPDGMRTEWVPKSKKIWFTEYGFPSVDCCTNQPNVFYSPNSFDSAFPRMSKGIMDFKAQRVAITATEEAWQNSECVERLFLYTWDARPYPYYPNLTDVWSDGGIWKYGHFLNGKAGIATLANVIKYLCYKLNLKDEDINVSKLEDDLFNGYLIDDNKSILNHLRNLAGAFNFDTYLEDGKLCFKSLKNTKTHIITEDELIIDTDTGKVCFEAETIASPSILSSVSLLFLDIEREYTTSTANANDNSKHTNSYKISVPMPLNLSQAQELAWRILTNLNTQTTSFIFELPITHLNISPLDTISIKVDGVDYLIRVKNISIIDSTKIKIIGISMIANDNILSSLDYSNILLDGKTSNKPSQIATTNIKLFELYNIDDSVKNDLLTIHCAVWSDDDNWQGATLYYSTDNGESYDFLSFISAESCIGKLVNISNNNNDLTANIIDTTTKLHIILTNENEKLKSITDEQFSQLKNIILVGKEIIAFRDVVKIADNEFELSYLLRGRFNTDNEINNHFANEDVCLIDNDIKHIQLPLSYIGKSIQFKAVSVNDTLENTGISTTSITGNSLLNFETKNLDITKMKNGDIRLSFSPRKNYKINITSYQDVAIITNLVCLKIYNKQTKMLLRTINIENKNYFIYSTQMQIEDFGETILPDKIEFSAKSIINI